MLVASGPGRRHIPLAGQCENRRYKRKCLPVNAGPAACTLRALLRAVIAARGQHRVQRQGGVCSFPFADFGVKHGNEVPQLRGGEAVFMAAPRWKRSCAPRPGMPGQSRDGRQLPALMVQRVARENVRKKDAL